MKQSCCIAISILLLFLVLAACGGGGGAGDAPSGSGGPPGVTTLGATSVAATGATLGGNVIPDGLATTAWFEWGASPTLATFTTTPSQSAGAGATSVPVNAILSGLSTGTTYYYRVAASNSSGTSKGAIVSFTAGSAPSVTTNAATSVISSSATLNGNVTPNGLTTNAWFEWGTSPTLATYSTTRVLNVGSGLTAVGVNENISGLNPGSTYYYRAVAQNGTGLFRGGIISFTTRSDSWIRTYGGALYDLASSVQQTTDGGYIVAGQTSSIGAGNGDVYLIKTDSAGNAVWAKTFGGANSDYAQSVRQTSDGGFIVAGQSSSFGAGNGDVYLIKTDSAGNAVWTKTFGGGNGDYAFSVQQTSDGGYVVAGGTFSYGAGNSDVYLIKTDSAGNAVWEKTFGGTNGDWAFSVQQTSDGGYIVAGSFGGVGDGAYLIKTDSAGNAIWTKTFGGTSGSQFRAVQQTSDGGFIAAGSIATLSPGNQDVYLVRTDSAGNVVWTNTFGGTANDLAYSVQQTSDGGFIIAGENQSISAGGNDVYLIKTDSAGNAIWEKTFGGTANDLAFSVQQTSDGGYIAAGYTASFGAGNGDIYLIKTDANGNAQ